MATVHAGRRPTARLILLCPLLAAWVCLVALTAGCQSAQQQIWPATRQVNTDADGPLRITWDTTGDGRPDYEQITHPATGMVEALRYRQADGTWGEALRPADSPTRHRTPTLVVMLDGIPHALLAEMWNEGYFRLFARPSRMVSVFPSMTDPAFGEMFCANPINGYEAVTYDRRRGRVVGGPASYLSSANEPWLDMVAYRQAPLLDAVGYIWPEAIAYREVLTSYQRWCRDRPDSAVWYFASADAVAHMTGWSGARRYLANIDRLLQRLYYQQRGAIRMALLSDHGNNFVPCRRIALNEALRRAGLREVRALAGQPDAVAIPRLGLASVLYVYADHPDARRAMARALAGCPGVELWCHRTGQTTFRVDNPAGHWAHIHCRPGRSRPSDAVADPPLDYAYKPGRGDPLALGEIIAAMRAAGQLDPDGFASGDQWLAATANHVYPDPLVRIVRGLSGLTTNDADILVSLAHGWYWGDPLIDLPAALNGTHGGLSAPDSMAFFTGTESPVAPPILRAADMLTVLNAQFPFVPRFEGLRCPCLAAKLAAVKRSSSTPATASPTATPSSPRAATDASSRFLPKATWSSL